MSDSKPTTPFVFTSGYLPDVDKVAPLAHARWIADKLAVGVTSRLDSNGQELMVEWDALPEDAKESNRILVREVYSAIDIANHCER